MDSRWFKDSSDKAARKRQVETYRTAFKELTRILDESFEKKESVRDYDTQGWEHRQIAVNEYNQVLKDIKKLIDIED